MTPADAWFAAKDHLKSGKIEDARRLLDLLLPSDKPLMARLIADAEKKLTT